MIDMEDTTVVEVAAVTQSSKGERGEVGTASAAQTLKKLWHFEGGNLSLKQFARGLSSTKNDNRAEHKQVAQEWLKNKAGGKDAKRSEANQIRTRAEASATKLSRKGKK